VTRQSKKRLRRTCAGVAVLIAMQVLSTVPAPASVLCVGPGGHVAVERAHAGRPCDALATAASGSAGDLAAPPRCSDTPVVAGSATRPELPSSRVPLASMPAAILPAAAPEQVAPSLLAAVPLTGPPLSALRTVVLRV